MKKVRELMQIENFTENTKFYRYVLPEHIEQIEDNIYDVTANDEATEMIEDHYDSGHLIMAKNIGPGLAFTIDFNTEYKADNRICIELKLKDILDQGGKIYEDKSSYEEGTWFFTIPKRRVRVKKIG